MTLSSFVVRNTFRNKRRSMLTMLSIGFSLLLLTLMMSIWRTFYIDQGRAGGGQAPDHPRSRFAGVFAARVLSRQDSHHPRRHRSGADDLVWRPLQG